MTLSDLRADARFTANVSSSQYSDTDIDRNINRHYDRVVSKIWNIVADWQFDEGKSNLPIATCNLAEDQSDYQLPTDARQIERVEIYKTNWITLKPIDQSELRTPEMDSGTPAYFDLVGRSLVLYPAPSFNGTGALRITLTKSVTPLSETTDEPAIDREFQGYISLGAALDWCISKGNPTKKRDIEREMKKYDRDLKAFYANRNKDYDVKIKPTRNSYE